MKQPAIPCIDKLSNADSVSVVVRAVAQYVEMVMTPGEVSQVVAKSVEVLNGEGREVRHDSDSVRVDRCGSDATTRAHVAAHAKVSLPLNGAGYSRLTAGSNVSVVLS